MDEKFADATIQFLQQKLAESVAESATNHGRLQVTLFRINELEAELAALKPGAGEAVEAPGES